MYNWASASLSGNSLLELIFLGTSASAPSVRRGLSAQIVSYRDYRFLVDCGEGTQRQILRSGLGFRRLNTILITHGHLDHILGLGGLLSTFARWETIDHLEIWAGAWALDRIKDLLFGVVLRGAKPPIEIELRAIEPGQIFEADGFRVSAFPVTHRGPGCFGFIFEEPPRRPFNPDKADELGVPAGPLRSQLVRGEQVTLSTGVQIQPDQVLGKVLPGTRHVHIGDSAKIDNLIDICSQVDSLTIEATYLENETDLARKFGHLTAAQAGKLASKAKVGHLFLTHISRRYRATQILAEAKAIFPHSTVARDFDHFQIRPGKVNQKMK